MTVKTKSFRRTVPILTSGMQERLEAAYEEVETECNAFLATLDSLVVLDVGKLVTNVGKDGIMTHIEMWVTFKE